MVTSELTLPQIYMARQSGRRLVHHTPPVHSSRLEDHISGSVYLKLDNLQAIGSFKIRGTSNRLLNLEDDDRARGVVTSPTGNHGLAVAFVAGQLSKRAVVCLSNQVARPGKHAVVVVSSGNMEMPLLFEIARHHQQS